MKLTTFDPLIVTKDAQPLINLFMALGFEKRHEVNQPSNALTKLVRMRSSSGFHVDIAQAEDIPHDITQIRMNVDDFGEAREFLISRGFIDMAGDKTVEASSALGTTMVAPSGFQFALCQHVKDHN